MDIALRRIFLLATLFMAGCVTAPEEIDREASRLPPDQPSFSVSGKAKISTLSGIETANLTWSRVSLDEEYLRLAGPIGMGATELVRRGPLLAVREGGAEIPVTDFNIDNDARRALASLPVEQIGGWLLGYTDSTDQWQVSVSQWQGHEGWRVPRKLRITSSDLELTLVLLTWRLGSSTP